MATRFIAAAIAALLAFGLVGLRMGRRTVTRAPRTRHVAPLAAATVDADHVAHALGRTIRHQTISRSREDPTAAAAFEALHADLAALFPRVHGSLERLRVGDHSLLYSWPGSQPDLKPVVLVAHQDVVPVDPGSEHEWSQPPFSGAVRDGYVWGRGALDDKGSLVAILAAVEDLLADGFVPRRTLLLAIGHDEEPSVLPTRASVTVNFRILPGETVDDVVAHTRATIADERVRIEVAPDSVARDPSATSPASGPAFALLAQTILACFPDVVVAPYLVLGGTDARHYEAVADHVYRFVPLHIDAAARELLHGTDERVAIDELAGAVAFYLELIRRAQRDL